MKNTKDSNTSQRVLKSIEPAEEITINISQKVSGSNLGNVIKALDDFRKCFNETDEYSVQIKVDKVITPQKTE
ncbi:MAG: hypothetical protein Q8920_04380 [Bacillota bacterium]|nr:hypothetical protein [Bacillota bacterium]